MNPLDPHASPVQDAYMVSKAVSAYLSRIGKLARGVPKNFTSADRARRAKLAKAISKTKRKKRSGVNR